MPTNNGAKKPTGDFPDFIRCELADKDKKFLQTDDTPVEALLEVVEELLGLGVKVSLNFEEQNDCYGGYATGGKAAPKGMSGKCLSARGPTLVGCLRALVYKHSKMLGGDWSTAQAWSSTEKWR